MDALFEQLALLYVLLLLVAMGLPRARSRALAGAGLALLGLAAAADRAAAAGADTAFSVINELLAVGGVGVVLTALVLSLRGRRQDDGGPGRLPPATTAAFALNPLLLAGLALAVLAPHLLLLGFGATLAIAAAVRATVRARRLAGLIPLLAGTACLAVALSLMLTIRGPLGGGLADLSSGPYSVAAERLLVALLGAASLLFAGLPPLQWAPWGRGLSPLSALLLARVIAPALPEGLATWQAPAMLILTAGLLGSAWRRRWSQVAVTGGLLALWTGVDGSVVAGSVLVGWGWVVESGAAVVAGRGIALSARWAGFSALPAGLAALPALEAGLRAQVLLSVAAVTGCTVGLALEWKRGSPRVHPPL